MNTTLTASSVGDMAVLAWAWMVAFAPRILAAAIVVAAALLLSYWLRRGIATLTTKTRRLDPSLRPVLSATAQYAIFVLMLILVLNQLGIQTTSLLTVLGAAGLAVGLALQGTLSNIAAGIMLLWLRPFEPGDYVEVNGMSGSVKETGLFATIITTYDGLQLFAPNATVWNFALRNHTRATCRMLVLSITVAGDGQGLPFDAIGNTLRQSSTVLQTPAPLVFLDQVTAANATLVCRFWTAHADFPQMQRQIVQQLRTALIEAGVPAGDIQAITRVAPPPTDPTRLADF